MDKLAVPAAVTALADCAVPRLVWVNEVGGLTYEVGTGRGRRFVKWAPAGSRLDLAAEAARLTWAGAYTPVPDVMAYGEDGVGSWLVMSPLRGRSAVDARWQPDPATAVREIGAGLRAMHDALPVESCPFGWQADERVADANRRAALGLIDPAAFHDDHRRLSLADALAAVADTPPIARLVVCHGDTCAPNTLLDDRGRWSGHVDLGSLGVADRWADLAVATWSTTWNYGPGWEQPLLDAYGIAPDPVRTRYYRLLWELGP
jgi:aminoglycoside phosphotransferase